MERAWTWGPMLQAAVATFWGRRPPTALMVQPLWAARMPMAVPTFPGPMIDMVGNLSVVFYAPKNSLAW